MEETQVSANVVEAGPFERVVEFSVPEADIESAKGAAARKLSRDLKIRGFRPGKAPRPIVEATVGPERLRAEAIDDLVPNRLGDLLDELDIDPAVTPELESVDDTDTGIDVKVRVTLWPTLDQVPEHDGRRIEVGSVDVDDTEVSAQIDRIREQFAELSDADRPAENGDYVTIDIGATLDGVEVPEAKADQIMYEVGSEGFIDGVDDHLLGAEKGSTITFDAPLPQGFGERAGTTVTFVISVTDVKQKVLPELTDEWVSEITEFSSVTELEVNLEERMGQMKRESLARQFREKALEQLVDEVVVELPEALLRSEMDEVLHRFVHRLEGEGLTLDDYFSVANLDQGQFVDDLRSQASRSIRTRLLLEGVAERAGVEVSDDELAVVIESIALQSEKPDQIRKALRDEAREKSLVGDILRNKALEVIITGAVPVDEDGNEVELTVEEEPSPADGDETVVPAGVPVADSVEALDDVVDAEVVDATDPEVEGPLTTTDVDEPAAEAGETEEEE